MPVEEPSAADLRAVAVAKLKRAASLPRIAGGRRPPMPMHDEAVSEGDKSVSTTNTTTLATEATSKPNASDTSPETSIERTLSPPPSISSPPWTDQSGTPPILHSESEALVDDTAVETQPSRAGSETTTKADESAIMSGDEEPPASGRNTPLKKRRRRSRSRSRGSKDFKEIKAELARPLDSSPEELPPIPFFQPALASPLPPPFIQMPRNLFITPPHPFLNQPGTVPPSLDAIRAGLMRSNSARAMAMNKLTGGRDSPTNPFIQPPTTGATLGRSATVTGVERSAARNLMLRRLEKRAPTPKGGLSSVTGFNTTENDALSEAEDALPVASPVTPASGVSTAVPPTHSKRVSPAMSNVVDDRDLPPSPTESRQGTPSPLEGRNLPTQLNIAVQREHRETLAKLMGQDHFEFDTPARRRHQPQHSILVEEEDDFDDLPPQPTTISSSSSGSMPAVMISELGMPSSRKQKISEFSSLSSVTSQNDTERIPLFFQEEGQKSPYAQDTFPVTISPTGTPPRSGTGTREVSRSDDDDLTEEKIVYPEELKERRAAIARLEREVDPKLSWVGDHGMSHSLSILET